MIDAMEQLGVDIGGVIIQPMDDDADTSFFGDNYLATPAMPGVFAALATLVDVFEGRVHLVSKCGEQTANRTRKWLAHHDFHGRTGVPAERLHFCRTRPEKAPIVARLGLTHFIDDRLEVLGYLTTVPHRFLFRPNDTEVRAYAEHLPGVRRVESWPELLTALDR
jgi:hypothetical protein